MFWKRLISKLSGSALLVLSMAMGTVAISTSEAHAATTTSYAAVPLYFGAFISQGIIDANSHLEQTVKDAAGNYWVSVYRGTGQGDLLEIDGVTRQAKAYVTTSFGFDPIDGTSVNGLLYYKNSSGGACPIGVLNPTQLSGGTTNAGITHYSVSPGSNGFSCPSASSSGVVFNSSTVSGTSLASSGTVPSTSVWFTSRSATSSLVQVDPQNFTEVGWFKSTVSGPLMGFANSTTTSSATKFDRLLWLDPAGHLVFGIYNAAVSELSSPKVYNDGTWHFVAVSLSSSGGTTMYVDGAEVASSATMTQAQSYSGYWSAATAQFNYHWVDAPSSDVLTGSLAGVGVIPSVLNGGEISALYSSASQSSYDQALINDSAAPNLAFDGSDSGGYFSESGSGVTTSVTGGPLGGGASTFDGSSGVGAVVDQNILNELTSSGVVDQFPLTMDTSSAIGIYGGIAYIANSSSDGILAFTLSSLSPFDFNAPTQTYAVSNPTSTTLGDIQGITSSGVNEIWFLREFGDQVGYINTTTGAVAEYSVANNSTGDVEGMVSDGTGLWIATGRINGVTSGNVNFARIDPTNLSAEVSGSTISPTIVGVPASSQALGADDFVVENGNPVVFVPGQVGCQASPPTFSAETPVSVNPACPVLTISKSDSVNHSVTTSANLNYTIQVGVASTSQMAEGQMLTLSDPMPTGIVADSASGTGWTCAIVSDTVNCTYPIPPGGALGPGDLAPLVTVVATAPSTAETLTNTATASSADALAVQASDPVKVTVATVVTAPSSSPTTLATSSLASSSPSTTGSVALSSASTVVTIPSVSTGRPWSSEAYWITALFAGIVGAFLVVPWRRLKRTLASKA